MTAAGGQWFAGPFLCLTLPFQQWGLFPSQRGAGRLESGAYHPIGLRGKTEPRSSSSGSQQRAPGRWEGCCCATEPGWGLPGRRRQGPGCPRQVVGSRTGDPVPSPGQGEECPAAEVGHLNCRCGRPWSGTSSGRSGPCAGALAKVVAVWQHFSCPCLPPFSPRSEPSKAKQLLGSRQPPCARKWSPAEINIAPDLGSPPHASSARTESSRALPPALLPPGPWVGTPAVPVSRPSPPRPAGLSSSSRPDPTGWGEPQFSI